MKKGMITRNGLLYLERVDRMVSAACPFSSEGANSVKCGEWCPHFGEPEETQGETGTTMVSLRLSCGNGRTFMFGTVADMRWRRKYEEKQDLAALGGKDEKVPV